ncbi:hypothetical protein J7E91_14525 [Streptomyces sp. ISL-99]|uniref:hypothetical protein n=1 Tax=Streptomyces sp. ISL-99 TaxID=2819193 RepID=UPI001BE66AEE|nr:hypothetical protein [Streptomyces sp. ISL-99]MBT2526608.1 hypothetical protein [Streptomyces sp. ISL-99]
MEEGLWLRNQTWADLDPAGRTFDADVAYDVVAAVPMPDQDAGRTWDFRYEQAVTRALAERFGTWVVGWNDSTHFGGPVAAWCCPSHSVTTEEETPDRVVDSLEEWWDWLQELAEKFDRLSPAPDASAEDRQWAWERATARLATVVLDRTSCEAGWYGHCQLVLRWYLESNGVSPRRAEELVEDAVGGRFESWTDPGPLLVGDVAERIAAHADR